MPLCSPQSAPCAPAAASSASLGMQSTAPTVHVWYEAPAARLAPSHHQPQHDHQQQQTPRALDPLAHLWPPPLYRQGGDGIVLSGVVGSGTFVLSWSLFILSVPGPSSLHPLPCHHGGAYVRACVMCMRAVRGGARRAVLCACACACACVRACVRA